ncbi:MAG: hypothetical protein EBV86_10435 [Marivivens sp.]|nr:hypothetical protein [Marivivens sp.]
MTFVTQSTSSLQKDGPSKTLLIAHHGFGKTYQCRYYAERYGRGLILSGESGLKSVEDVDIDYLPFSSWDGKHNPDDGVFSFKGIVKMMATNDFKDAGFKWIAIDSLTEMSDRCLTEVRDDYKRRGDANTFQVWADYNHAMIGALKWVRDLPLHVYVTCLAKEETDANDSTHYWPMVQGRGVSKQVPALFDHVFCGVKTTEKASDGKPKVSRYVITDEVNGWHGKTRDPRNTLKAYEKCDDVTSLLARIAGDKK